MGSIQRRHAFYSKRRSADHGNEILEQIAVKARREPNPSHFAGPSHHARLVLRDRIKDSEAIRSRGGWSDGGGGEGELRGVDRAGCSNHPPPGISCAYHCDWADPQAWQDGEAPPLGFQPSPTNRCQRTTAEVLSAIYEQDFFALLVWAAGPEFKAPSAPWRPSMRAGRWRHDWLGAGGGFEEFPWEPPITIGSSRIYRTSESADPRLINLIRRWLKGGVR